MADLVRWQFDGCNRVPPEGYDKWWTDMNIVGQIKCEHALCIIGNGEQCSYQDGKYKYIIDFVEMTQRNEETGRVRPIRRTITEGFDLETHYFQDGKLKRRRVTAPDRSLERRQREAIEEIRG